MEENIKNFVIDASYILEYLLPDEKNPKSDIFFEMHAQGKIELFSTQLLPFEVVNFLKVARKRKRIAEIDAKKLTKSFFKLNINLEGIDFLDVLKIALKENLSVYDASYLSLAKFKKIKILTLDKKT